MKLKCKIYKENLKSVNFFMVKVDNGNKRYKQLLELEKL